MHTWYNKMASNHQRPHKVIHSVVSQLRHGYLSPGQNLNTAQKEQTKMFSHESYDSLPEIFQHET